MQRAPGRTSATRPTTRSTAGVNILILSDRAVGPERAPIPSLLAVAAVHHHLVREGTRLRAGLVLESGEPREVHHFATLIGYGASAINPYLLFDTVDELVAEGRVAGVDDPDDAERNVVKAIGKGLLKTISKMGISTIQSYCGAQIFEAVGLEHDARRPPLHRHRVAHRRHRPRRARPGGARPPRARLARRATDDLLPVGGVYAWRRDGEHHMWNPETIALLQHAVRATPERATRAGEVRRVRAAGQRGRRAPRDAARAAAASATDREPIPLDEVEPATEIVKRFATGAMSLGSISTEAHETLAIAMNRLGGTLEHRRGRGGPAPLHARRQRRPAPLGDQAGRLGPLRRDDPLPRQRRPAADQDGPGRQARRGRPAARPQGRQVHRLGAPHDARASA